MLFYCLCSFPSYQIVGQQYTPDFLLQHFQQTTLSPVLHRVFLPAALFSECIGDSDFTAARRAGYQDIFAMRNVMIIQRRCWPNHNIPDVQAIRCIEVCPVHDKEL